MLAKMLTKVANFFFKSGSSDAEILRSVLFPLKQVMNWTIVSDFV